MNDDFYFIIGLMSGTSLDGIDLVFVKFDKKNYKNFKILAAETIAYSSAWKDKLQGAINFSKDDLIRLDIEYAVLLSEEINGFIKKNKIDAIDFIASHGHTILHQPAKGITLQIGHGKIISEKTNQKVICDFRTQDVALGGQGAPLVPIGDELLFSEYDFCVNLGGFANVSYHLKNQNNVKDSLNDNLGENNQENTRIAFDICPVNIVLNHYVQKLGFEYDDKGQIAKSAIINQELLRKLNALDFYKKSAPKSLGLEWVRLIIFPLIDTLEKDIPAILRTFIEHAAIQIGKIIHKNDVVLITGGGVFNDFLMNRIEFYAEQKIEIPSKALINYKEALIFAFLGLLRIENQVNCLKSVTGAKKDHSSGVIFNK
ncbi:anhydro-N-acetylmuramic acid kinase [Tenacibaculum finnmarkense]|uniref:Anhydro-N-acetylmuramic acid kinase n=1 Tax=Tenacibaculum finnmarkense genomovar finnmarkense TaxID=1458503 RepID=A0AAP1RER5_9FLAO|nr:anhydro-N-acetylmuramic acid kinase [Tenacibaculum finnmarkense]MBE7652759.1 anhydro-N-acetylmuramic acid kinase [Tenacibaculum finnmarkense genomovar finnmarkense]MBE7694964.1 anhydro-N-acetylmuramic acid kinase [Tenacibaculum finnmarkense genomovar finnmarkense]MCD8427218.1 anhydro-N-acetylmuramic acid kinase [Tenacibaculum finnmarkense genomovar finnmarkense]MCG8731030.1 anhydro-N-acetylmuramic acid kinase [Tenacibaculum finnmarkense]MCG8752584.1 anhydro-N-acetylmuramic acid kinase [Tena